MALGSEVGKIWDLTRCLWWVRKFHRDSTGCKHVTWLAADSWNGRVTNTWPHRQPAGVRTKAQILWTSSEDLWSLTKEPQRPLLFNVYSSNVDLQFPALDKSLKPLFTFGKVKIANLDSGTLEQKENWFSVFFIEICSQITPKNYLSNCTHHRLEHGAL